MGLLNRLWTGIVGAVAGAGLALVLQIIGQMTVGLSIEHLEKMVISLGLAGLLVGFAVGNHRIGASKDKPKMDK